MDDKNTDSPPRELLSPVRIKELDENNPAYSLKGAWLFRDGDDQEWKMPTLKSEGWSIIQVPGQIEKQQQKDWDGFAWYRLPIIFPVSSIYQNLALSLGRIGDVDEVFLDGRLIGKTGSFPPRMNLNWKKGRIYQIPTGFIKPKETQYLTVRIYNHSGAGGFLDGPVEISLFKEANQKFLIEEGGKLVVTAVILVLSFVISLLFLNRPQEKEALLLIVISLLYSLYTILNNNLLDLLASSQLIRLKFISFAMLFLPLAIKAFFYLIWDIKSKLSYWLYSGVIIIMFFIILLTSRFELILLLMGYLYPYLIIYPLARLIFVAFKERQTRKKEANIILLIIVLNIAAALNDYLKFQGTWYLPELSPYGLCAFFIAASVLLENRIIRHQKNIEDRNIVLERALLERISEKNLRQQQLKVDTVLSFFIREKILANRSINIKNFKGEFFSKPVDNIGRDYFDIFPITGGKHCILLCDLSYAGISAVLLSAHLRLNRDKFLKKKLSLQNIHKIIKELNPMEGERKNMGLLLLFLDPKRKIIQLINDSMPKPLLYSSKFGATSELSSLNEDVQNPLDKSPNTLQTKKIKTPMAKNPSLTNEFPMGKGDRLILVSNGIPNSTSMSDFVQFGSWNTLKFFSATKKIPMQDLGEIFFTELEIFLEGKKQQNDWTFFVIEST